MIIPGRRATALASAAGRTWPKAFTQPSTSGGRVSDAASLLARTAKNIAPSRRAYADATVCSMSTASAPVCLCSNCLLATVATTPVAVAMRPQTMCLGASARASSTEIQRELKPGLQALEDSLGKKSRELWNVIKTGRTHLQDATPIRLGQEFLGYQGQLKRAERRVAFATVELLELAIGGTAVGTGINAHPKFAPRVCDLLSLEVRIPLRETDNHFQAQSALDGAVMVSGVMKSIAVTLTKIANDIRWMGCGPRAGLGEIEVPAVQPGSSIMPGKVNPVIAESVLMVCQRVIGNDVTITAAASSGNFELLVAMPVIAEALLESITLLGRCAENFAEQCIDGIVATRRGPESVEAGLMLGTALAPVIGYEAAAAIAKEAAKTGRTIREVAREKTQLSEAQLTDLLNPEKMVEPSDRVLPVSG